MPQRAEAARLRKLLLARDGAPDAPDAHDGDTSDAGDDEDAPRGKPARAKAPPAEGDMVVTFGVGLGERMAAKRAAAAEETVWQAHLRERKEKRQARKAAAAAEADGGATADLGFDDLFFSAAGDAGAQRGERKRKRAAAGEASADDTSTPEAAAEARRRAELELLLIDDARLKAGAAPLQPLQANDSDDEDVGADRRVDRRAKLSRKEARAAAKAARRERRSGKANVATVTSAAGTGTLDVADARFAALFTRPEFALDPTDSRFKAVRSVDVIRREAAVRRGGASVKAMPPATVASASGPDDATIGSVVARLKHKALAAVRR